MDDTDLIVSYCEDRKVSTTLLADSLEILFCSTPSLLRGEKLSKVLG